MSLEINAITFQFLQENFLSQLKRQCSLRSKPSKAVLEALKHSTTLNKQFKNEIQILKNQLSQTNQQNEFLKEMIQNLKNQVYFIKNSKQQTIKKLCQIQTKLHTQVECYKNQNHLLRKQVQLLKQNRNLQASFLDKNHQQRINRHLNTATPADSSNFQYQIDILSQIQLGRSETQISYKQSQKQLNQSAKFNQYVNFEQKSVENIQTRANSKIKIQKVGSNQNQIQNFNKIKKKQCQQLTQMLFLNSQSNSSKQNLNQCQDKTQKRVLHQRKNISNREDDDDLDLSLKKLDSFHSENRLSSLDQIQPKITQITSQQQIFVQQKQIKKQSKVQTPNFQKCSFNPNQSKFLIFASGKQQDKNNSNKSQTKFFLPNSQYTFLQLQTRKSIEQMINSKSSSAYFGKNSVKISITQSRPESIYLREQFQSQTDLQNISGVDYQGLLNDIYTNQNNFDNLQNDQQNNKVSSGRPQNLSFKDVMAKRTASELFTPEQIKTVQNMLKKQIHQQCHSGRRQQIKPNSCQTDQISKNQQQQQKQSLQNVNFQKQKLKQKQNVKIAVHSPYKYMNITQSYKTIDLDKPRPQQIIEESYVVNFNQSDNGSKSSDKSRMNNSSYLARSRTKQRSRMVNSRVMTNSRMMVNSKMMMLSNRLNRPNKSLSPLSIDRQIQSSENSPLNRSRSQKRQVYTSYGLINQMKNNNESESKSIVDQDEIKLGNSLPSDYNSSVEDQIKNHRQARDQTKYNRQVVSFKQLQDRINQHD